VLVSFKNQSLFFLNHLVNVSSLILQVWQIVRSKPGLQRISFVAHSLGGLFQRYAIANLYNPNDSTIAGLEPIQFVTIATPHLGMRGSKSVCYCLSIF